MRLLLLTLCIFLLNGCASYGVIENKELTPQQAFQNNSVPPSADNDIAFIVSFSGGGTRAAALSYGVLQALDESKISTDNQSYSLLDKVDAISAVSGGSFTAAYYGLHGNKIFDDFEDRFLKADIESGLISKLLNPLQWFSSTGRTKEAVDFYNDTIFNNATFADMEGPGKPKIIINASDLANSGRFSFIQEYFDLLCSDIDTFPIARAVAASSAVPVLFQPVVLKNYPDCQTTAPKWIAEAKKFNQSNEEMILVTKGLESYLDKDKRQYIHLVDGGITDNLGLRAIYELLESAGGAKNFLNSKGVLAPKRLVILSVNASVAAQSNMDKTTRQPSLEETINAISDVQLHRYNAATIELIKQAQQRWATDMSTPSQTVEPYFIQLDLADITNIEQRQYLAQIPTSFALNSQQVEQLISAAKQLIHKNSEYKRLISDLTNN